MTIAQRFAQVFGAVYLLVGIVGFIPLPPFLVDASPSAGSVGGLFYTGFVLGLFAVNYVHNIIHAVIGIAGLAVYRSPAAASAYALVLGVAYLGLFILGLFTGGAAFNGLLPLNEWDDVLHIVTSLAAFGAFFASRRSPDTARA